MEMKDIDELPPAVRATVERETTGGQIEEIERESKDGRVVYEVEFTRDGLEIELEIAEDGTVLEREEEEEDE
jgi:uncharacterized membrane protein YkoI